MDYKKKYEEVIEKNRAYQTELENLQAQVNNEIITVGNAVSFAFQSSSQLMALMNLKSGHFIDVNESFLKVLGYSREEIIGKTTDEIGLYADTEESRKYLKLVSKLRSNRDLEITLNTKKGEKKSFLFSAETMQNNDDNYLLMIFLLDTLYPFTYNTGRFPC